MLITPDAPVFAPAIESAEIGASFVVRWDLPEDFTPSPKDWISLASLDMADTDYLPGWKYTSGIRSGEVTIQAPLLPGSYELRYYLNDGFTVYQRAPFQVVVQAPTAQVQNITAEEMQGEIDKAIAGNGQLVLDSDLLVTFTSLRRNLRVYGNLCVRSQGKSKVKMGPDLPSWTGQGWALFRLEPGNYDFEIRSGVDFEGPKWNPTWVVRGSYSGHAPEIPEPHFVHAIGSQQPGLRRTIYIDRIRMKSKPEESRGFGAGFHIEGNAPGSITSLQATQNDIDVLGQAFSGFGSGSKFRIIGNTILSGWIDLFHCAYIHQGHELDFIDNDVTTRDGKACVKWAGQAAEGGSRGRIAGNVFRSGRVAFRRLLGIPVTPEDYRWGVGLETDWFIPECEIEGNDFDRSLWIALQHAGGFNMKGGVIKSAYAFSQFGDQTGFPVPPICSVQGTRFQDVSHIMASKLEGATWIYDGILVDSDEVETLFGTHERPQNVYVSGYARIRNPNGGAFHKGPGEWDTTGLVVRQ